MEWFGCRQQMKMFISIICSDDDHRVEYENKSTIVSKHANTFQEIQYLVHYQHLVMKMHFDLPQCAYQILRKDHPSHHQ
jgi:hypothetical protein